MGKRGAAGGKRTGGAGWSLTSAEERSPAPPPAREEGHAAENRGPPTARVRLEKRRGKPVTACALEGIEERDLRLLARQLRQHCGTGGTARAGEVELQGDHRERLREFLRAKGFTVRG